MRYSLARREFEELLEGQPAYRIDQIWDGLYRQGKPLEALTNVPAGLRLRLAEQLPSALTAVTHSVSDRGDTVKWLWELHDGARIESVLMHYSDRTTVCISSQAGCAMGCGFCATGQAGFDRQLRTDEIVEQVQRARHTAADKRVSNVVFMGMGEPMANYDNVWRAVEILHSGVGLSARHLTISTVGIVPGIERMAEERLPVNLAVSLHAANDELRDQLVPINRRYPLEALVASCRRYLDAKGRRLSFEWAMIADTNDRDRDADELASVARGLHAHVNLIPLNPTPGYPTVGSSAQRVREFAQRLTELGVNATVRQNRGTSIDAACGQLSATHQPVTLAARTAPVTQDKPPI